MVIEPSGHVCRKDQAEQALEDDDQDETIEDYHLIDNMQGIVENISDVQKIFKKLQKDVPKLWAQLERKI